MVPVVTASQMKKIDRQATEVWGIPSIVLMENAGRTVVEILQMELGNLAGKKILIVCGKGNNGGDGMVITRHLINRGAITSCVLLSKISDLKGDAGINARILLDAGMKILEINHPEPLQQLLPHYPIIIDAIFGTGLSAPPEGLFAETIQLINQSNAFIVSVDVPSGVDADTGKILAPAVSAQLTVTMGLPKLGLLLYPAKTCCGKLLIADIGIPRNQLVQNSDTFLVDEWFVKNTLPPRPPDGHKGTFGTCLLICGSRGYSGAACLTAMAAVRAGAGLVHLAYPQTLSPIIESRILEPVKHPLPETDEITLSTAALTPILKLTGAADVCAIGPGISTHPQTRELLLNLLPQLDIPVVLDADGINNLSGNVDLLKNVRARLILTPHPGELARLTNTSSAEINSNRVHFARAFARNHNCVLVLKGAPTVIAAADGRVYLNPTGNSGLATGGTGDVLTGLITGLIAQGADPLNAAIAGVYLHGKAGDLAAQKLTEYALTAEDLLKFIPAAFVSILNPS
ncbi:MAG: NAD(P)H-hydrate dehydratase [bacterium]